MSRQLGLSLLFVLLLTGCSLPRLVILNDPLDARQHNDLGVAYEQRGEFALALREYGRAAELDTAWAQPLINRGNVQAAQQLWTEAASDYRRALRREPEQAEAMNNMAWVLLQSGDLFQARSWVDRALLRHPQDPAFLDTFAEIQIAAGDYVGARRAIDQALTFDPSAELRQSLEELRLRLPKPHVD